MSRVWWCFHGCIHTSKLTKFYTVLTMSIFISSFASIKAVRIFFKKSSNSRDFNSRGYHFFTLHGPLHIPGLSFPLFNRDKTWFSFRLFLFRLNDIWASHMLLVVKNSLASADVRDASSISGPGPWRWAWQPTPVFFLFLN